MRYIFLLSGDYIEIAKEEILSLINVENYKLLDRLLIAELKNDAKLLNKFQRLALTKRIYRLLFKCKINDVEKSMRNFDWNSVYRDNFCLRTHNFSDNNENSIKNKINKKNIKEYQEKDLARFVWHSVKNPKVDLENPKTKIEIFVIKDNVYCCLLIFENKEGFESRKANLRPFPHSSSLHPKLARAIINITGVKENEILIDPFCGTGGFLIEAGLMNIKAVGYDIYKPMIKGCIQNLKYYKIKDYKIKNKNAIDINDKFDYVVTDLPYGLNSNALVDYDKKSWKKGRINLKIQKDNFKQNLEQFYLKFLKNLRKKLKKKAVIVFPNYVNYRRLLKTSKFKIENEFSNYVHGSLTRKIVKLS